MGLWNYCEVCGERIETGQPCIGGKEESKNLSGLSICMNCAEIENLPDGREPVSITDLLARVEAADILGDNYDLDRLRDLVQADRDGRCVVLPCKEGDKLRRDGIEFTADHWNLILTAFAEDKSTKSGKRVGLFGAKEAEAALKARDGE